MTDHIEVLEMCKTLERYGELEGSEMGHYWLALANFYMFDSAMMADNFRSAVIAEIKEQVQTIEQECEIVTHTETETVERSWQEIVWIGE